MRLLITFNILLRQLLHKAQYGNEGAKPDSHWHQGLLCNEMYRQIKLVAALVVSPANQPYLLRMMMTVPRHACRTAPLTSVAQWMSGLFGHADLTPSDLVAALVLTAAAQQQRRRLRIKHALGEKLDTITEASSQPSAGRTPHLSRASPLVYKYDNHLTHICCSGSSRWYERASRTHCLALQQASDDA